MPGSPPRRAVPGFTRRGGSTDAVHDSGSNPTGQTGEDPGGGTGRRAHGAPGRGDGGGGDRDAVGPDRRGHAGRRSPGPRPRQRAQGEYFLSGGPGWPLTDLKATIPDQRIEFPNLVPTFAELTGRGERTSARWTGQITPDYSEAYTFSAIGDNGFRLWIDDQLVIDHWVDDWDVEQTSAPVQLQAGQEYAFRMEMFQNTGGAHLRLRWQSPSQDREIVPTDAFTYPDDFVVFPAQATLESDGTSLNVAFQGPRAVSTRASSTTSRSRSTSSPGPSHRSRRRATSSASRSPSPSTARRPHVSSTTARAT